MTYILETIRLNMNFSEVLSQIESPMKFVLKMLITGHLRGLVSLASY